MLNIISLTKMRVITKSLSTLISTEIIIIIIIRKI